MKKSIILSTILLGILDTAHAADNLVLFGYKFGKPPSALEWLDFIAFALYIGQNLIGIAGFIAIIYMMIGGVTMVASAGNPDQVQKGKNTLTYAIIGFIVAITAYLIVNSFLKYITGIGLDKLPRTPSEFNL